MTEFDLSDDAIRLAVNSSMDSFKQWLNNSVRTLGFRPSEQFKSRTLSTIFNEIIQSSLATRLGLVKSKSDNIDSLKTERGHPVRIYVSSSGLSGIRGNRVQSKSSFVIIVIWSKGDGSNISSYSIEGVWVGRLTREDWIRGETIFLLYKSATTSANNLRTPLVL